VCDCDPGFRHPDAWSPACAEGQCGLLCLPVPPADGGMDGERPCVPGAPELCNGWDDDCNGLTDESFEIDFDAQNCAACGRICEAGDHATPACVLGDCTVVCAPKWSDLDGDPANGCEVVCEPGPAMDETACDGRDDDCNGLTDENWTTEVRCGHGFCEHSAVCFRGEVICRPRAAPAASDATCDGIDDDCDGLTDEDCGGADADADAGADADADAGADADAASVCGNGVRETGEECDDGNRTALDGCENDCTTTCHAASDCDDFDDCTIDSCPPTSGGALCAHEVVRGARCDDGDPCTDGETCDAAGTCSGGSSICTCVRAEDCAPFEDGDLCNGTLACVSNSCRVDPRTVVTCSPAGDTPCRRNTCNPDRGTCEYQAIGEGAACDDGLFCTATDRCSAGACIGTGNPCPAGGCVGGCDEAGDRCRPASADTVCRVAAGDCDVPETCNGSSTSCPADGFAPSSTVCRPSAGVCDVPENCTGDSAACPTDAFRPSAYECRPSAGVCDAPENCTGGSATCPTDAFRPSSYECRRAGASPICDPAERCTGRSATCPADYQAPNGTICRDDGTLCGSPKDCQVCNGGNCVQNGSHWSADCLPSCGVIGGWCGTPIACCGPSAVCSFGEPGGASWDCGKCCAYACCYPSEVEEYTCHDGRDNDCDVAVDCEDSSCDGRSCGLDHVCRSGLCVHV